MRSKGHSNCIWSGIGSKNSKSSGAFLLLRCIKEATFAPLPRTTERPVREIEGEPREIISSVKSLKIPPGRYFTG